MIFYDPTEIEIRDPSIIKVDLEEFKSRLRQYLETYDVEFDVKKYHNSTDWNNHSSHDIYCPVIDGVRYLPIAEHIYRCHAVNGWLVLKPQQLYLYESINCKPIPLYEERE